MAITPGTERILSAAAHWRERSLLGGESVFTRDALWTADNVDALKRFFVDQPDFGKTGFVEKLRGQLGPATPAAKQLAAEMLWVMMLFPSNLGFASKSELVTTVWEWSGVSFPRDNPLFADVLRRGIGSGGPGYNNYRPDELTLFVLLMGDWRRRPRAEQEALLADPWRFGTWLDTIPGAQNRQFRHMLLHLLFPEHYERVSSNSEKRKLVSVFSGLLAGAELPPEVERNTLLAQDRRILLIRRALEAQHPGVPIDFYASPVVEQWKGDGPVVMPNGDPGDSVSPPVDYVEPPFPEVVARVGAVGLRMPERTLRAYHLALKTRGFVILSGVSGSGKTWLAEAYADAVGARLLVVPVAPNWTSNEDLLGYASPLTGTYQDTAFSRFLRQAAAEHEQALAAEVRPPPYHLVLDEMNLARVEHYFARFLSAMEMRARGREARVELASDDHVPLPPNLKFVGTVNMDETTHAFADKVLDRAQRIEIEAPRDALQEHLGDTPWAPVVLAVWDELNGVAPFAYRLLDEIAQYVAAADGLAAGWEELVDDQIMQKILPRIRGTDPRLGDALARIAEITAGRFPVSHARAVRMRDGFGAHGFATFG